MARQVAGSAEVRLSEKVLGSVVTAWKVGREALAFLVIGTVSILLAFWLAMANREWMAVAFLLTGSGIIGVIAYKFYVDAVIPAAKATAHLEQNAKLMDAVQDAALQLTNIITQINDYALQNAETIVSAVEEAKEILALLPGGNKLLRLDYFKQGDKFAKGIRSVAAQSRDTVAEIRDAVTKADAAKLAIHAHKLRELRAAIESELLQ